MSRNGRWHPAATIRPRAAKIAMSIAQRSINVPSTRSFNATQQASAGIANSSSKGSENPAATANPASRASAPTAAASHISSRGLT